MNQEIRPDQVWQHYKYKNMYYIVLYEPANGMVVFQSVSTKTNYAKSIDHFLNNFEYSGIDLSEHTNRLEDLEVIQDVSSKV